MELDLNNNGASAPIETEHENVLAGAVGAFLFALAGGAVWVLLSRVGIIAGISGLIAVVCAVKGYSVFAKRESKKGIVIAVIMAILVIVIAWYAAFAWDFYDAAKEWYAEGEIDVKLSYFDCLRNGYELFAEKEIAGDYFKDLAIGLFFCIIASVSYIVNYSKKLGAKNAAANVNTSAAYQQAESEVNYAEDHGREQTSLDANESFDENAEN